MQRRALTVGLACLLAASCGGGSELTPLTVVPAPPPPVTQIAVYRHQDGNASPGSYLRFNVAYYLREQGFSVIESLCDGGTPQGIECLQRGAVDAVIIQEAGQGHDSWRVRLVGTASSQAIAAVSWKSAWCAFRGSPCDERTRAKARAEAGVEIGRLFFHALGRGPDHSIQKIADGSVVINGRRFLGPAESWGLAPGDRVRFLSESPFGTCKTAKLLDLRTQQAHEVECRY